MPLFDQSTLTGRSEKDRGEKAEPVVDSFSGEETVPGTGKEGKRKDERVTGPSKKLSVILKPEHVEWVEEQDLGLSEWVRNAISEEIKKDDNAEPEEKDVSDEEKSSGSEMCDVCGENPATEEDIDEGEVTKLCKECFEKRFDESPPRKGEQSSDSNSDSNQPCAICGEVKDSVKEVPMGPGRGKKPLCRICAQEEGFRLDRRRK